MSVKPDATDKLYVGEDIVLLDVEAGSDQEALDILARKLHSAGIVKESYIEAVKAREIEYCTGLQFEEMGIAIPHTDAEHVNKGAIGIAILKNPVAFKSMGMPDIPVDVEIVFMMAIKEPEKQLEFLQKLMKMFQTEGRLKSLKACTRQEEVASKFESFF